MAPTYTAKLHSSPLNIPPGSCGRICVEHRTLYPGPVDIVGRRQAILTGRSTVQARIHTTRIIHALVERGRGVWMTDSPEELNQIHEMIAHVKPRGHVLVGGLGLGILARILADRESIKSITVVEKDRRVISLCGFAHPKITIIRADIAQFVRREHLRYDAYLLDTWAGTSEGTWWNHVMPLRRMIRNRHGDKPLIWCWAEDIMIGQVRMALETHHTIAKLTGQPLDRPWFYKHLPAGLGLDPQETDSFVEDVGSPQWERCYGEACDAAVTDMEKENGKYA